MKNIVLLFLVSSIHGELNDETGQYMKKLENHRCSTGKSLTRLNYSGRRGASCANEETETDCITLCNGTPRCVASFMNSENKCVICYFCDLMLDDLEFQNGNHFTTTFRSRGVAMYPEATISEGTVLQSTVTNTNTPDSCVAQCNNDSNCNYVKIDAEVSSRTAQTSLCNNGDVDSFWVKCTLYGGGKVTKTSINYLPNESPDEWSKSNSDYNNFGIVYKVREPAPTDSSPTVKPTQKGPTTKPTSPTTKKPTSKPTTSKPTVPTTNIPTTAPTTPTTKPTPAGTDDTVIIVVGVVVPLIVLIVCGYIFWVKRDWIYARLETKISIIPK